MRVGTHRSFADVYSDTCILIDLTHLFDLLFPIRVCGRSQPIPDQVGLQIPFFKSRAACRGEICVMIPRRMISSANSRPVQWLMGRSFGCEHPSAITQAGFALP